ncbi:MAG: DUF1772 domain-containing protein [Chitinophagaceae bacterium]|nr:DUF1772 domain-containing protein [Chitinophagaceae bacterium]MCW5928733.1 DUF1772 domain-containing protein [Chitinophagaceae bacterium]
MAHPILRFLNIVFSALLAGTSFGIWLGFNPTNFSASTYIEQQQNLVHSLNTLMIILVVAAAVTTLISAYLQRKNKPALIALLLATAFFISCMVITRFGNVPLQAEMLKWTTDTLPENWTALRDKWWSLHIMRTVVELIALVLVTWTIVQKKTVKVK